MNRDEKIESWILLAAFIIISLVAYCGKMLDCRNFKHNANGYVGINNCGSP